MNYGDSKTRFNNLSRTREETPETLGTRKDGKREEARNLVRKALEGAQGASSGPATGGASPVDYSTGFRDYSSPMNSPTLSPLGPTGGPSDILSPRGQGGNTGESGEGPTEAGFKSAMERLIESAPGKVTIYSGRRDSAKQQSLWNEALKKYGSESAARKWVAPPMGTKMSDGSIAKGSRHEHGLANDIRFEDSRTREWVHDNAHKFGLHFPLDNENWHIEPIGSR